MEKDLAELWVEIGKILDGFNKAMKKASKDIEELNNKLKRIKERLEASK